MLYALYLLVLTLFKWCFRIGVNESRAAGAESWHNFTDSSNGLSLKAATCCNERFTYKASGEVSRFSILHPSNKRLFPSRGPSRSVFRSQFDSLCQNCRKSIRSSNPSLPNAHDEASTKFGKRYHNSNDFYSDGKSVSSSKRCRLDEASKNGNVKPKKFNHIEGLPVQKKAIESKQASHFCPSLSSKKLKAAPIPAASTSKKSNRSLICVQNNAGSGILHVGSASHEKSRRLDRHVVTTDKGAGVMDSHQRRKPFAVPAKPENEKNLLLEPQHRPPIKIKINRSLILSNGDAASNKGGGEPEIVGGYKVSLTRFSYLML